MRGFIVEGYTSHYPNTLPDQEIPDFTLFYSVFLPRDVQYEPLNERYSHKWKLSTAVI
jgi:hypothetical protein